MSLSLCITYVQSGRANEASWSRLASPEPPRVGGDSREPKSLKRMFILGMGFVGNFFGEQLRCQGWDVSGTCTSVVKKKKLQDMGFDAYHFDANEPDCQKSYRGRGWRIQITLGTSSPVRVVISIAHEVDHPYTLTTEVEYLAPKSLTRRTNHQTIPHLVPRWWGILDVVNCHTHLLVSIPPLAGFGDPMLQHGELLKNGLMGGSLQWLCYLSSTSVYGNSGGEWVDEEYPASPTSELSKLRLAAEERWLNLGGNLGIAAYAFRLGGIYGPGRSAVDTILKQEALSEGQRRRTFRLYTPRIHVEDICQALQASFYASSAGKVYNIVDDDPAPREEVFAYAQSLIEKKWPGQITRSFEKEHSLVTAKKEGFAAEKRVSNARMKKELGVRLVHPSYRTGLQSIIDQMDNPFRHILLDS